MGYQTRCRPETRIMGWAADWYGEAEVLPDAEVAVIGAGPAGSALAASLGRLGHHAILIDRSRFPRDKPCGEGLMPSGVKVLMGLGIDLAEADFPSLSGVRYRLPDGRQAQGAFRSGRGHGVRRIRFDALLAGAAASTPEVELHTGVTLDGIRTVRDAIVLSTSRGDLRARAAVAADGIRSTAARLLGWEGVARPPHRHAVLGHLDVPGHGVHEIVVTLLPGVEVYAAPSGRDELLVAVLGGRGSLRHRGATVAETFDHLVGLAHPELGGAPHGRLRGAGPFRIRPPRVAEGRIFLLGDAAGFLDPLTGDAISAALTAAAALARLLDAGLEGAAPRYRRWIASQWRRRWWVSRLALSLTRSERRAGRALGGLAGRPSALEALLEVNDGGRALHRLGVRDWAALAGL
ncbi:MAG: FAD-dependent monooxygenase [Candidatus Dormibacteraceae bacterium]